MSAQWKEVSQGLQSQDDSAVLEALQKLQMVEKSLRKEPTNKFIPRCIDKLQHHDITIRATAMAAIDKQLKYENTALGPLMDDLVKVISQPNLLDLKAGKDGGEKYTLLHTSLCSTIIALHTRYMKKLMAHYKPLGGYLVECLQQKNKEIAGASCEYWAKLQVPPVPSRYMDIWVPVVMSKLQKIIPGLLNCMIYHQDHLEFKLSVTPQTARTPLDADKWVEKMSNVRNYAALGFEHMCKIFQSEVTAIFKPYLERYLGSDDWLQVEASILALGAFTQALGTPKDMKEIYPRIMPQLIDKYTHPEPLVRAITCFTMQNFINFTMKGVKDPLPKIIKCTVALLEDEMYDTKIMALRCIATILAYAERDLAPYTDKLVYALTRIAIDLKGEASYSYYECIGQLFGRSGDVLEDTSVTALMEPLMNHWRGITISELDEQHTADTVLICQPLSIIASFSKSNFARYNEAVFAKVSSHVSEILRQSKTLRLNDPNINTHLVAMLDVTSAIFEGQGSEVAQLGHKYKLNELALEILQESDLQEKTHQSMLALLGHLAIHCFDILEPQLDDYILICQAKLTSSSGPVRNNALWTLSGLAKGCKEKNTLLLSMSNDLATILRSAESDQGQATNAALALTHLARKWPHEVIGIILRDDNFMTLCTLLQMQFQGDREKVTLFINLCVILESYMKKASRDLWPAFLTAVALCDCNNDQLMKTLQEFLRKLRTILGNKGWSSVTNQIGPQLAVTLRKKYKLY